MSKKARACHEGFACEVKDCGLDCASNAEFIQVPAIADVEASLCMEYGKSPFLSIHVQVCRWCVQLPPFDLADRSSIPGCGVCPSREVAHLFDHGLGHQKFPLSMTVLIWYVSTFCRGRSMEAHLQLQALLLLPLARWI